jgi:DDE family transposase
MITHPSLTSLSTDFSRADLFLVVFCLVDDWMKARFGSSNAPRKRRGPRDEEFSDAELLTVLLVGELCRCPRERAWLRQVRASYRALFPALPENSRFCRRAQQARHLLRTLREALLFWADADLEPIRILDSFPMPLCACYRIHQSNQPVECSSFGRCASKRSFFFGLRPHLLITASGFIVDLILAPGHCADVTALGLYLDECLEYDRNLVGQIWLLDKGYRSQRLVRLAHERLGLTLVARQQEPKGEEPTGWQLQLDALRRPIEGVVSMLTEGFSIEHILATTGIGLYRRAQAKATAFTLARYFNRVLDLAALDIARYAV